MPATSCPGGHDRPTQDSHPVKTLGPDSRKTLGPDSKEITGGARQSGKVRHRRPARDRRAAPGGRPDRSHPALQSAPGPRAPKAGKSRVKSTIRLFGSVHKRFARRSST
jgi:hypothetical protein